MASSGPSAKRSWRRNIDVRALEQRIAFDAAAADTVAKAWTNVSLDGETHQPEAPDAHLQLSDTIRPDPSHRVAIAFIDAAVEDLPTLLKGLSPDIEVVLLDGARDGVVQIAETLAQKHDVSEIHIISHGSQAALSLGTGTLSLTTMEALYSTELKTIGTALSADGDLLIYGCDFGDGETGQDAVDMLAALTGADIAASNDPTGAASLGGDWDLEISSGRIEANIAISAGAQSAWQHSLATATFQQGVNSYTGTQDTYLNSGSLLDNGSSTTLSTNSFGTSQQTLLRFDSLFGSGASQIPTDATIKSATLTVYVTSSDPGDFIGFYQMNVGWSESSTWSSMGSGVSTNGTEASSTAVASFYGFATGAQSFDVTASVQSWLSGTTNNGWVFTSTPFSPMDWRIASSEGATASQRPLLTVVYGYGAVISNLAGDTASFVEGGSAVVIDQGTAAVVTDQDSTDFSGGNLTVSFAAGSDSTEDVLGVRNQGTGAGQIGVSGSNITYGGTTIGTYTGGSNGANLVISLNASSSIAATQALVRNVTYINTDGNDPLAGTRTVRFSLSDASATSANYDAFVTVTAVNDAPVESGIEGTALAYTENQAATAITSTITLSDVDNTTLSGATVQMSNFVSGQDVMAFTDANGITGNLVGGTLTLSGTATVAQYQAALRSITYRNTSDAPNTTSRTVNFTVTDGALNSNTVSRTITITAVNDAPVESAIEGSALAYTENQAPTTITSTLVVTDADNANLSSATVEIVNYVAGQDVLAFTNGNGITGTLNNGILTLSGSATVAQYQDALRSVTYQNTSDTPTTTTRQVRFTVNDGQVSSTAVTRNITITAVNDAPVESAIESAALAYTEDQAATALTSTLTLTDADSANLTGATIQFTSGFASGQDVLAFTNANGITGTWNSGTLTLTGTATVAQYQAALRSITYQNTSSSPSTTLRTVSFTVTDGSATSAAVTRDIVVTAVNDAPVASAIEGTAVAYTENQAPVAITSTIALSDLDNSTFSSATVQIVNYVAGQDVLAFTNASGITGSWNAGTLTLTGSATVAQYQAALRTVTYQNTSDNPTTTTRQVSFTVNDGTSNSNTVSRNITIAAVNDAPVQASIEGTALAYAENQAATAVTQTLLLSDPDSANLTGATVQLSSGYVAGQDVLAFTNANGISGTFASGTLTLTGTATVAQYQAALRSITYQNTSENPTAGTRTIRFTVTDGALTATAVTRDIAVTAVNDVPVASSIEGASLGYTENQAPVIITSSIALSDVDNTTLAGATVQITNYAAGQEVLAFTNSSGITGSWAAGTLTLSGSATVAQYQAALRSITYQNSSDNPTTTPRQISFTVTDGSAYSAAVTRNIAITAVNDAPVQASIETGALAYAENQAATEVTSTLALSDADNADLTGATVQITSGYAAGQDVLAFTNANGITGTWNNGTLTLAGTATVTQYQAALRSITYQNTSENPTAGTRTLSFSVTDGSLASNTVTRNISVAAVNDAPVATSIEGSPLAYTENMAATAITSSIAISDVDNTTLSGATVQITNYVPGEDLLAFTNTTGITGSWSAGTLTLTGSATITQYQAALRSITYQNTSDAPSTATRIVSFTVSDGTSSSAPVTRSIALTAINDAPSGIPIITGTPTEDMTLTADTSSISDADGLGSFSYQWLRDGIAVTGATSITYHLSDADVGGAMSVRVSYTDGGGTIETLTSTGTSAITNVNDAPIGSPSISGTASEGRTLTAHVSGISDDDGLGSFSYVWKRDGVAIPGANATTYTLTNGDVGSAITVTVSYLDGHGTAESVTSAATSAVTNINDAPHGGPVITGSEIQNATLTADATGITDSDGIGPFTYRWERDGVPIMGAAANAYTLTEADVGRAITVTVTYLDGQGTLESVTSAATGLIANVNDAPAGAPVITGTEAEDQTLTADVSGLSDPDGLGSLSYQWLRNGAVIGGATSSTYVLRNLDVGASISVRVSYTDGHGASESITSAVTGAIANVNDAPAGRPSISGLAVEGETLTADAAGITDADGVGSLTYQWLRNGASIVGANASSYVLVNGDVGAEISVRVSYTDGHGTPESVTSDATGLVANVNDVPSGLPIVTGSRVEDQTLTADITGIADGDGLGAVSYQWLRDGAAISGAVAATYTLQDADVGHSISVTVAYTDLHGTSESLTSAATAAIANVNDAPAGSALIVGTLVEGQQLTADGSGITDVDGTGPLNYQWYRDGVAISGATSSTLTLTNADVGAAMSVAMSYTDGHGTLETVWSTPTAAVLNVNDAPVGVPVVSGAAIENVTLTADTSGISDADGMGAFSYQWLRDGSQIAGATGATYLLGDADVGHSISVAISYTDAHGTVESRLSGGTAAVQNVNDVPTGAPTISGIATEGQTLTADASAIADADGLGTLSYQWYRDGVLISGATGSTYTTGNADVGRQITVAVSYVDGQGTSETVASAATSAITNVNDAPTGTLLVAGSHIEGQTLTADIGSIADADGLGTNSYQWYRNGAAIVGATGSTYVLTNADVGATVSVDLSYTDGHGTLETFVSAATGAIQNVNDAPAGLPVVLGTATENQSLSVDTTGISDGDGLGAITYRWLRDGGVISGATGSTYLLGDPDVGHVISVEATFTDGHGTVEHVVSAGTIPVVNVNDAPTGLPSISGTLVEHSTLFADVSSIADADGFDTVSYQWNRGGVAISGATGSSYTLGSADVGNQISVSVSYVDRHGTTELLTSTATTAIANVNDAPTGAPVITGSAVDNQTLGVDTSAIADADGLGSFAYQWKRDGVALGATGTIYVLSSADIGHTFTVDVSYIDGHGATEVLSSAATAPVVHANSAPVGSPLISGSAVEGETLSTDVSSIGDGDGLGTLTYQWKRNGSIIAGATGSTYLLGAADVGGAISVSVGYVDGFGTSEQVTSAATSAVHALNSSDAETPAAPEPPSDLAPDVGDERNADVADKPADQNQDSKSPETEAPLEAAPNTAKAVTEAVGEVAPSEISNLIVPPFIKIPDQDRLFSEELEFGFNAGGFYALGANEGITVVGNDPLGVPSDAIYHFDLDKPSSMDDVSRDKDAALTYAASFALKTAGVSSSVIALSAAWALRATAVAGSVFSSLPLWARFDMLPVMLRRTGGREELSEADKLFETKDDRI